MGIYKSFGLLICYKDSNADTNVLIMKKKYSYDFETIVRGLIRN